MAYIVTQPCIGVKDATCVDVCPVDCIRTTDDDQQYYYLVAETRVRMLVAHQIQIYAR